MPVRWQVVAVVLLLGLLAIAHPADSQPPPLTSAPPRASAPSGPEQTGPALVDSTHNVAPNSAPESYRPIPPNLQAQPSLSNPMPTAGPSPAPMISPFGSSELQQRLKQRGDLTLRNTTLKEALFAVSESWNISIVFGKDVDGLVNGVFRNATLAEVLDSLLLANGYGYRARGQNLVVLKLAELGDSNGMLQSLQLNLAGGGQTIIESVRLLLSPQGKAQSIPSSNLMIVRDLPEHLVKVRQFVMSLPASVHNRPADSARNIGMSGTPPNLPSALLAPLQGGQEGEIGYFTPQFVDAKSLQEAMQSVLGTARVAVMEDENRLIVVADSKTIALAREVVAQLDVPRPQVRITAMIYDVNLQEMEQLGVNWTHALKLSPNASGIPRHAIGTHFGGSPLPNSTFDALSTAATAAVDAGSVASPLTVGATRFMTFNRYFDLSAIVNALDETKGARLLADPTVTVLDRENAEIKIVTEIPIQQLTQTSAGGAIGTTTFREAGVTLTVRPQIARDGTIQMQVTPTFSVLTGFNDGQPIIDSREATTKVRVADGQTLVLGGLRQRTEVETARGVPGMKDLRHIGAIFRDHETTVRESELLVFLRPEICHVGQYRAREATTEMHLDDVLDRIPVPSSAPMMPDCKDKYCPLHYPRPRVTGLPCQDDLPPHARVELLPPPPEAAPPQLAPVPSSARRTTRDKRRNHAGRGYSR